LGFEIVEERQPSFLFERSLLVTGEVSDAGCPLWLSVRPSSYGGHGDLARRSCWPSVAPFASSREGVACGGEHGEP
jgi:hypothetical protein